MVTSFQQINILGKFQGVVEKLSYLVRQPWLQQKLR